MEKRYQVFISSTFKDLEEERKVAMKTLMQMDCIPAGMELFTAIDEETLEFIKTIIDDCDYYLIIIGGRYGSLTNDGISFTEKEYDYAISKGLKVIALLHSDPEKISVEKSDISKPIKKKLEAFRQKVQGKPGERMVEYWNDLSEIPGKVFLSMHNTIKRFPAIGWVRANQVSSIEILEEINNLRKENDRLKLTSRDFDDFEMIELFLKKKLLVVMHVLKSDGQGGFFRDSSFSVEISLIAIFQSISNNLLGESSRRGSLLQPISDIVLKMQENVPLDQGRHLDMDNSTEKEILSNFSLLNLIEFDTVSDVWKITAIGKRFILKNLDKE
jgi:Domain of unknown function (DUF4062)